MEELGNQCKVVFASFVMDNTCVFVGGGGCFIPLSPSPTLFEAISQLIPAVTQHRRLFTGLLDLPFLYNSFLFFLSRILQDSMASTYEDEGPIPWYRTEQAIFYIVFFIVFPFFFVNIFVALIIVTFNELGEAELEDDMDKNQKSCIDFAIQVTAAGICIF
jgi:hypothetical protein